jgi:hypothetical protein
MPTSSAVVSRRPLCRRTVKMVEAVYRSSVAAATLNSPAIASGRNASEPGSHRVLAPIVRLVSEGVNDRVGHVPFAMDIDSATT